MRMHRLRCCPERKTLVNATGSIFAVAVRRVHVKQRQIETADTHLVSSVLLETSRGGRI